MLHIFWRLRVSRRYGSQESPPELRIKTASNAELHYKTAFGSMNRLLRDHRAFRGLLQGWLGAGRGHPAVEHSGRAAAIGYCFGGMAMFEMVR